MATKAKDKSIPVKPVSSVELQTVLKRVKKSSLSDDDKSAISEILSQNIKLKKLLEKSKISVGGKKVIARLPNGFDIVK
jgi:hypothetical protein